MLEQLLETYLTRLSVHNASVSQWIANGKIISSEFTSFPEVVIPKDLQTLWKTINGISEPEGATYEHIWLDGQFFFYSIDQSAKDYQITKDLIGRDPSFGNYWPVGLVPIGSPGDGSRLLVNCIDQSPAYGAVYELIHADGVSRLTNSLCDYFKMLNQLFENGVIKVLESGEIDVDFDAYHEVGREMNPDCDGFNDTLTPSKISMDWKQEER